MYKICIVGGGTAGSIVASSLVNYYKNQPVEVIVIASKDIKKVGVGESTTPAIIGYFQNIGIPVFDFIKNTNATIKNGIRFENWKGSSDVYYNNFLGKTLPNPIFRYYNIIELREFLTDRWTGGLNHSFDLDQDNRVPFVKNTLTQMPAAVNAYALHIDALGFSEYIFEKISDKIKLFNESIVDVEITNQGIDSVRLESGEIISADSWIDCSGLQKLLISKLESLDSNWESFEEDLIINRAIAASVDSDNLNKDPYTAASALDNGWCWQIPLQDRYGVGYVHNDQLISEDQAVNELEKFIKKQYNKPIENVRSIKFTSGCLKKSWIKNCTAIGLSSGFIEPLESTNIHSIIAQTNHFLQHLSFYGTHSVSIKHYNKKIYELQKQIKTVVKLHYLGGRQDSEFWRIMQNISDDLREDVELFKNAWLTSYLYEYDRNDLSSAKMFNLLNITPIILGLNLLEKQKAMDFYNTHIKNLTNVDKVADQIIKEKKNFEKQYISHRDLLGTLKRL